MIDPVSLCFGSCQEGVQKALQLAMNSQSESSDTVAIASKILSDICSQAGDCILLRCLMKVSRNGRMSPGKDLFSVDSYFESPI